MITELPAFIGGVLLGGVCGLCVNRLALRYQTSARLFLGWPCLIGGADIKTVAELMGHTDASMILKIYQHVQDVQKRAVVEALPDILNLAGPEGPTGCVIPFSPC